MLLKYFEKLKVETLSAFDNFCHLTGLKLKEEPADEHVVGLICIVQFFFYSFFFLLFVGFDCHLLVFLQPKLKLLI